MIWLSSYGAFLVFAAIVSLEDWRERKIRNERIVQGLLVSGAFLAYLVLASALGHRGLRVLGVGEFYYPWAFYPRAALHAALCAAAGLAMWGLSVWPAGDAKFYIVASLFLILIEPNLPGFPLLLFLVFLINIFVPAGLAFAGESVVRGLLSAPGLARRDWRRELKAAADRLRVCALEAWPRRGQYAILWVNLLVLFVGLRLAQARLGVLPLGPLGQLALFFAMAMAWGQLSMLMRRKALGLAVFGLVFAGAAAGWLMGWDLWRLAKEGARMTLSFGLFISAVRVALYWWIEKESRLEADAGSLVPGDILADDEWRRLKGEGAIAPRLGRRYCDGLSAEEAGALKAWLGPAKTTVYRAIPFAVWIFLGALITLSCPTTVVPVLASAAVQYGHRLSGGLAHAR